MRNSQSRNQEQGFSLIELLIVMVILGIMAGMAAPSLNGLVAANKTQRALDHISADIAYARMLAVRSGRPVGIRFSGTGNTRYRITRLTSPATGLPAVEVLKSVDLGSEYAGLSLSAIPTTTVAPTDSIGFNSRGMISTTLASNWFVAVAGGTTNRLELTPLGTTYRAY